jgi:hypothetical protein
MWTALAMTAALSYAPAQQGDLTLTNVRPTLYLHGPVRKDADSPKLLVGELFVLNFDLENVKVSEDGVVKYGIGWELRDKNNKLLYKEEPLDLEIINSVGGTKVPGYVMFTVGADVAPGEYTVTALVKDRAAKVDKTLTRKFEVLPTTFGLVRLGLSYDDRGTVPAPPLCVPGQRLLVNFFATGFERDKTMKTPQPHITFKMRVLQDGKPVLGKEASGVVKEAPEAWKVIPASFFLYPNRVGKFTVEVEAVDELAKKKASHSFELTVQELK